WIHIPIYWDLIIGILVFFFSCIRCRANMLVFRACSIRDDSCNKTGWQECHAYSSLFSETFAMIDHLSHRLFLISYRARNRIDHCQQSFVCLIIYYAHNAHFSFA
ncbi:hypothetical protein ACJX0J_026638, partial [Zea mays]